MFRLASLVVGVATVAVLILGLAQMEIIVVSPYIMIHEASPLAFRTMAVLFTLIVFPTGLFFVKKGLEKKHSAIRRRTVTFGAVIALASLLGANNYGLQAGYTNEARSIAVLLMFTCIIWLALKPVTNESVEKSPLQHSYHRQLKTDFN